MSIDHPTTSVEYRLIPFAPGYRIGDDGSAWSRKKRGSSGELGDTWKQINVSITNGYHYVNISVNKKYRRMLLHRLVLTVFVGPCPPGMEACHDPDPDRSNCRLDNLRWDYRLENCRDRDRHGTTARGSRDGSAKLRESDIPKIRGLRRQGMTYAEIGRMFGVSAHPIGVIIRGNGWRHVTE